MKAWFARLEPREQWMLSGGAALAVLIILWGLVWVPMRRASAELQDTVANKQALLTDLHRVELLQKAGAARARPAPTQSLVVLVDQTARAHGLAGSFTRTRPNGNDLIDVSFQNAPFDGILDWLLRLDSDYGVSVESASFTGSRQRGLVTGQISLRRS